MDEVLFTIPVRLSNRLSDRVHIHQYPLLTRPLQTPPSAIESGRKITARIKPQARRLEIHVPADTRRDVWNSDRAREFGGARLEDDREKNQATKTKDSDELTEIRMRSEEIPQNGAHMLGIVRDSEFDPIMPNLYRAEHQDELHLHPINETHQFRPTLTYLDILSRKSKRSRVGSDSDSDDGPPPDPDEPPPVSAPKKEKKPVEVREIQVSTRKADDKNSIHSAQSGLSAVRREMLQIIRKEEDEDWEDIQFHDITVRPELGLACVLTCPRLFNLKKHLKLYSPRRSRSLCAKPILLPYCRQINRNSSLTMNDDSDTESEPDVLPSTPQQNEFKAAVDRVQDTRMDQIHATNIPSSILQDSALIIQFLDDLQVQDPSQFLPHFSLLSKYSCSYGHWLMMYGQYAPRSLKVYWSKEQFIITSSRMHPANRPALSAG